MGTDTRRERANNFTENEKELLIKIVIDNFFDIIESKKTDSATIKEKNEAWYSVSQMFNESSHCNIPRNVLQLRNAYHNMKKRLKKEFTSEEDKKQYIATLAKINSTKGKFINMLNLHPDFNNKNDSSYNPSFKDPSRAVVDFVMESPNEMNEIETKSVLFIDAYDPSFPMENSNYTIEQNSISTTESNDIINEVDGTTHKNTMIKRRKYLDFHRNADRINSNKKTQIEIEILKIKQKREEEALEVDKVKRLQEEEKLRQQKIQTELLKMQLRKMQSEELVIGD